MKMYISIFALIFFISCTSNEKEAKATVIERRVINDTGILVKYSFDADGTVFTDSIILPNRVIPHDSFTVIYPVAQPEKNVLNIR